MKQVATFMLTLFFATLTMAKEYRQEGIAYLYDYKTKTKRPIANVSLTVADAKPTVSGADGTFVLLFENRGLGDKIVHSRQPYFQGLKIFNKKEFDNWFIVKDTLRLIMCRYEEFELAKNNYYQQGLKAATERYERQIAQIKADAKLKEAEKNRQLQEAEEALQKVMESLSESSEDMARIDQSELDDAMKGILDMYERGEVSEAVERLKALRLAEKFDRQVELRKTADENVQTLVRQMKAAVPTLKNNGEWQEAGRYLKRIADELDTYEDVFEYALFCAGQNNFSEAEIYFKRALDLTEKQTDKEGASYLYKISTLKNNLALLYANTQRFSESESMYKEASEIYRRLAKDNPQVYEPKLATTLNNLAILYSDTQRFSECESMYKEALEIRRRLAKDNPQAYEPDVALTLNNLAILYSDTRRFSESESMFKEALEIRRRIAKDNPQAYKPYLASTLGNLAILYSYTQRFSESESMYREALEIRRRLAKDNPQAYEPDLATTLNNLAILYKNTQRFSESESMYKEALEISRRLAKDNPQAYEPDVAMTLNNLAILYKNTQRFSESESKYKEALEIRRRLAKDNPQAYKPYLASTLGNLSFNTLFLKKYTEAEQYAREGMATDSTKHWIASNLAAALLFQGKYTEAERIYRQYKDELKESFLDDFKQFEEAGVIPKEYEKDVEKIKYLLNE